VKWIASIEWKEKREREKVTQERMKTRKKEKKKANLRNTSGRSEHKRESGGARMMRKEERTNHLWWWYKTSDKSEWRKRKEETQTWSGVKCKYMLNPKWGEMNKIPGAPPLLNPNLIWLSRLRVLLSLQRHTIQQNISPDFFFLFFFFFT